MNERREQSHTCDLPLIAHLCPTLCDPVDCSSPGSSVYGDSPGKNTGVGFHALLQGIFQTLGLNPGLSHCRQILYHLSHQGSPYTWDGERVTDKDSSRWVSTEVSLSSWEQLENTSYLWMSLQKARLSYSSLYLKDQPYIDFFCGNSQLVNGVFVYVYVLCMYVCVPVNRYFYREGGGEGEDI